MNLPAKAQWLMPLERATQLCADLSEMIDGQEGNLDEALDQAFNTSLLSHAEVLDLEKAMIRAIAGNLKAARGAKKELDVYVKKQERLAEKIEERVIRAFALEPRLPWRDSTGQKVTVCDSTAALKATFDIKKKKSFEGVLHEDAIKELGIPKQYIKTITLQVLDTAAVKADLAKGVKLTWAELEPSKQVRGLKPPKEKKEDGDDTDD